jgi:hypothetical protein
MVDLVGTCPKDFWEDWIAEGDAAGDPYTGEEWGWWTKHPNARLIRPGDRFYVVAHGMLRGWAPVTRVVREGPNWVICRRGDAVACTLDAPIKGFRGLETRWWDRRDERVFPDWKTRMPDAAVKPNKAANPGDDLFQKAGV